MPSLRLFVLAIVLAFAGQGMAQTKVSPKAQQLHLEAVRLHISEKYSVAVARMTQAAALAPKDQRYQDYLAELRQLAAYEPLDQHALKAPPSAEETVEKLAAYLIQPAKTDHDKARLIFRWITDRIAYDVEGVETGQEVDTEPADVLKSRKTKCQGYGYLFVALGKAAGLEVVYVRGFTKGSRGQGLANHGWNAVKLDGSWQLIDPTWGAGTSENRVFLKHLRPYNYLVPPEEFVFTRLPRDPKWQMLPTAISQEEFERYPYIKSSFFWYGFKLADARAAVDTKGIKEFVVVMQEKPGPRINALVAPIEFNLTAGRKYRFRFDAPGLDSMVYANGSSPVEAKGVDGIFDFEVPAQKGTLLIAGRRLDEKVHSGVFRYQVQ